MLRAGFVLWFGMLITIRLEAQPPAGTSQSLAEAAPPMARSIVSLLPRRATVSLEFQALAQLAPADWSNFRSALQDELRKAGIDIQEATQPDWRTRVTVSENTRGLLLIAEVINNDARQIVMAQWGRPALVEPKANLRIQAIPIVEQSEPILDVWLSDSGLDGVLLGPNDVTAIRLTNGKWIRSGQVSLAVGRPMPRDPRGRLISSGGGLAVYLPGTTCTGSGVQPAAFTCEQNNQRWTLNSGTALGVHWISDRNVLESEGLAGSFYNAAEGWFALASGKVVNHTGELVPGTENWGSDLAAVANPCRSAEANAAIVAAAGDSEDHDQLQAFVTANDQPVAASAPLAVGGVVTALWPSERPAFATLVIHNPKTGNYEASRLALACAE